jgi:DNA-binding MarR family transcriptional regulator
MSELAAVLKCDKSYVTAIADQLEQLHLASRISGPDRRQKLLQLTTKGQATREQLERQVKELSPAMVKLTASERTSLRSLLKKYRAQVSRTLLKLCVKLRFEKSL